MITTLEKLPLRRIHFLVTFSNAAVEYSTASIVLSRERDAKRKTAYKTEGVMSHEKGRKPSATEGRTEEDEGTDVIPSTKGCIKPRQRREYKRRDARAF
ncbi:unnamed protein product [Lasius platythorax]|uniref:Uncharacterized protein n=1 Tax=Lasius platythorax TaxID=488582 RepID=A0AAV2P672_9HYME